MIAVDASVVVKWFADEPHAAAARGIFAGARSLLVPGHALGEIGEVLVRRCRAGEITRTQVELAVATLRTRLTTVGLSSLIDLATEIALAARASVYDALYVAAAARWDIVLVTADDRLVGAIRGTPWSPHVHALAEWGDHRAS